ncbi:MAG: DUF309 domain-containing protein [Planctomycetota bacterium]
MTDCCPPAGDNKRLTDRMLPPYAHVPGQTPHPVSDPAGHSCGVEEPAARPLEPSRWRENEEYCYGVDLFNAGFYWEAHEAWERVWIACGRRGEVADFLKGLIKLAAAAVKRRAGSPEGAVRHARRAGELFGALRERAWGGLSVSALGDTAVRMEATNDSALLTPSNDQSAERS